MGAVLAWSGLWEEPRIDGPRRGDPTLLLWRLMAAKSEKDVSGAQVAAKSPCRGAARRCAAARKRALFRAGRKVNGRNRPEPAPSPTLPSSSGLPEDLLDHGTLRLRGDDAHIGGTFSLPDARHIPLGIAPPVRQAVSVNAPSPRRAPRPANLVVRGVNLQVAPPRYLA